MLSNQKNAISFSLDSRDEILEHEKLYFHTVLIDDQIIVNK